MDIAVYIFSSIALSLAGMVAYLIFLKGRPGLQVRRGMIWIVIGLSLGLPFALSPRPGNLYRLEQESKGGNSLQDFCHCAEPGAGDMILFQAHKVYDFMLVHGDAFRVFWLIFAGIFLFKWIYQVFTWVYWVRNRQSELIELDGHKLKLIREKGKILAGSIRLGGRFVLWNPQLDVLPEKDRKAILLHELSHIRQCNTFEKLTLGILQAIWLFNPAFYLFKRELELVSEYIADDYAAYKTGSRKGYAALLLRLKSSPSLGLVDFFRKSGVRRRVERLVLEGRHRPKFKVLPAFSLGLMLLLAGELYTQSLINKQIRKMEVYEFLSINHEKTGRQAFCKRCTLEAVRGEKSNMFNTKATAEN